MMQNIKEILRILHNDKFPLEAISCNLIDLISQQLDYPRQIVKKGIADGNLIINNTKCFDSEVELNKKSIVTFQKIRIELPIVEESTRFDKCVNLIKEQCNFHKNLESLYEDQKYTFTALIIEYFHVYSYNVDELKSSKYNDEVLNFLENIYKKNLDTENGSKKLSKREIIEILLSKRDNEYKRFEDSTEKIISGYFKVNSEEMFNEIGKIINSKQFKILIKPLSQEIIDPIHIISKLKKSYDKVIERGTKEEKITEFILFQKNYQLIEVGLKPPVINRIAQSLNKIFNYYKKKCEEHIGYKDSGEPILHVTSENRTYNFNEKTFYIYIGIKNEGTGIARNVKIESLSNQSYSINKQVLSDILAPGEYRTTKFQFVFNQNELYINEELEIDFVLKWKNDFNKEFEEATNKIKIVKQKEDLPWDELFLSKPYNKRAIDDPEKLFGRGQLLFELQRNIEKSSSITSTIIYGQKRVGKSSIVKTLNKIYENNLEIIFLYKSIGDLKNVDALKTMQRIGESIYKSIINDFVRKNPVFTDQIKSYEIPSFLGSLSPLNEIIEELSLLNNKLRIIVCLDEFDELNQEFFENGELGKTFALNLGKGLNDKDNVGFILVGSENMTNKAKNGMRLNTYEQKRVDTFSKVTEFDSYCKLISEPTKTCLKFSPSVYNNIFDLTNGNPYFTNLIMERVFNEAYTKRISFIDDDFIKSPIDHFTNSVLTNNDFAHFLEDGLSEEKVKYEIGLDRRRRLSMALILAKKEKGEVKWTDIKRKIKYPKKFELTETQFEDTLKEFIQRGIIKEDENNYYHITPLIYEQWLLSNGVYQIIADLEDKDEILEKLQQENNLLLRDEDYSVLIAQLEEVVNKSRVQEFRSFIDQFDNNEDKRRVVDLLRGMVVITSHEAIHHIKRVFQKIWSTINLEVGERAIIKDGEIVCFSESFSQNLDFCEIIKDRFLFSKSKTIKTINDLKSIDNTTKNLIIYEPLIDCPFFYRNELSKLLKSINPTLVRDLKIHIICFIITDEAKIALNDLCSNNFYFEYEIHEYKTFQRLEICPFYDNDETINNPTWSLLINKFYQISNKSTLVKIGEIIPYQSFPVLWSSEINKFRPLYPSKVPIKNYNSRMFLSDNLENKWNFTSETNRIEFKASLIIPTRNWKEINKLVKNYKNKRGNEGDETELYKLIIDHWSMRSSQSEIIKKAIQHSIMKTISAFANTDGGKLFVGIEDDLTVQGMISDQQVYKSEESIRKILDEMTNHYLGNEYADIFTINFINLLTNTFLLEITVSKSPNEIWLRRNKEGTILIHGKEEFYIRKLQETVQLSSREYSEWRNKKNS